MTYACCSHSRGHNTVFSFQFMMSSSPKDIYFPWVARNGTCTEAKMMGKFRAQMTEPPQLHEATLGSWATEKKTTGRKERKEREFE